jgi:exopolysaccharide production protein ExoZ
MQLMSADSRKLQTIQGLRALAALLVVFQHALLTIIGGAASPGSPYYGMVVSTGDNGVFLFFAISGFIMMYTSRNDFTEPGAPRRFFVKRLLRIVPLYWLCMGIYALKLAAQQTPPALPELLKSFAFIPYENAEGLYHPVYPLGWTLNYEMLFYAIFAVSLLLSYRVAIGFVVASLLALVAAGQFMGEALTNPLAVYYTRPVVLYFVAGIGVFLLYDALKGRRVISLGSGNAYLAFLLAVAAAGPLLASIFGIILSPYAVFLAVFLLMAHASLGDADGRWDGAGWRTVFLLGEASFSIYLTHSFVLGPMGRIWNMLQMPESLWWLFCASALVGASILGVLTYHFVERPLMRLTKSLFARPAKVSGASAG